MSEKTVVNGVVVADVKTERSATTHNAFLPEITKAKSVGLVDR
jgi:hypothetical protein